MFLQSISLWNLVCAPSSNETLQYADVISAPKMRKRAFFMISEPTVVAIREDDFPPLGFDVMIIVQCIICFTWLMYM